MLNKTLSTRKHTGYANWLLGSEKGAIPFISPNDDDIVNELLKKKNLP